MMSIHLGCKSKQKTSLYNKIFSLKCVGDGCELFVECWRNRIILLQWANLYDTRAYCRIMLTTFSVRDCFEKLCFVLMYC